MVKKILKKLLFVAAGLFVALVLLVLGYLLFGPWCPGELEIGPETTVVEGPLREDGTVDYVAAANARFSDGVTPENNAFVVVAGLVSPDAWGDEPEVRAWVFEQLGVHMPGEGATYFVPIDAYAERHAEEDERWSELADPDEAEAKEGRDPMAELEADGIELSEEMRELLRDTPAPKPTRLWEQQWERASSAPWAEEEAPLVAEWLTEQGPALDRLGEAAHRSRWWSPTVAGSQDELIAAAVFLPQLEAIRAAGKALRARALYRLGIGQNQAASDDLLTLNRLSQHLFEGSGMTEQSEGIRLSQWVVAVLPHLLAHEGLTAERTRRLKATFAERRARPALPAVVDVTERFVFLDYVQYLWRAAPEERDRLASEEAAAVRLFDPSRAMRQANALYDQSVEALSARTRTERLVRLERLDEQLRQWFDHGRTVPRVRLMFSDRVTATDLIMKTLVRLSFPNWGHPADIADKAETQQQLVRVALAVAGYQREHGEYPASLDDLVPEWMNTVPVDSFGEAGEPTRYVVEDDRVVIYSVGPNGEDNNGVDDRDEGDIVIQWQR